MLARVRSHPLWVDGTLALLLIVTGIAGVFYPYDIGGPAIRSADPVGVLLVFAAAAPGSRPPALAGVGVARVGERNYRLRPVGFLLRRR